MQAKKEEFERDYKPELDRRRAEREKEKAAARQKELDKLMKDMHVGGASKSKKDKDAPETVSDAEDNSDEGMQVDDEDSEDEVHDNSEEGLKARYQQALQDTTPSGEDFSFARYIHQAKMG